MVQYVQQTLGGWAWRLSPALTIYVLSQAIWRSDRSTPDSAVAHDKDVGHCREVVDRVQQGLALAGRAARNVQAEITPADRRLAAISKVVRVRALFPKKRLNTPCRAAEAPFLTSRSLTLTKLLAVSRIWVRMS